MSNYAQSYKPNIGDLAGCIDEKKINALYKEELPDSRLARFTPFFVVCGWIAQICKNSSSNESGVLELIAMFPDSKFSSDATGGFSKAKGRFPEQLPETLAKQQAKETSTEAPRHSIWKTGTVRLVDGTTIALADTEDNQEIFPQHGMQEKGVGFPLIRSVFLGSVTDGSILDAGFAAYKGKGTGEMSIAKPLIQANLVAGDLLLADRYYEAVNLATTVISKRADFIFPAHGARNIDFRKGKYLGPCDRLVEYIDDDGKKVTVRHIEITLSYNGFRNIKLRVVTSLLDASKYPASIIAKLYLERWNIELDIRNLKCLLGLRFINCKSPSMVKKHFWFTIFTYNLICSLMTKCGKIVKKSIRKISFSQTLITFSRFLSDIVSENISIKLMGKIVSFITKKEVGNRPGRSEPRAIKKRKRSKYKNLTCKRSDYQ